MRWDIISFIISTACVTYASYSYFRSKRIMKELRAAYEHNKYLFTVMDNKEPVFIIDPRCGQFMNELSHYIFKRDNNICIIARMNYSGHLNGYVGITSDHPLYGTNWDNLELEVHYGCTYSDFDIAYIEKGLFGDRFWIGFDCAHAGDLTPFQCRNSLKLGGIFNDWKYRDFNYVKNEVIKLCDQLTEVYKNKTQ